MFTPRFSKYLSIIVCTLLLTITTHPLRAAPPSPAQLDELIRASNIQEMLSPAMVALEKEMRQTMGGLAQQVGMDEARKQRFDQAVVQRLMPQIRNEMSWQKLAPLFQEAFMQALNADDVEQVLAFHRSPAGRAYQSAAMELLKDPNFVNAINNPTTGQAALMLQSKLSPADFQAFMEFNSNPSMQRVQSRIRQIMPDIMQRSVLTRIESIVQNFMEQEMN